jgi:L-arabinose isomerase
MGPISKTKTGLLLIATSRFRELGKGLPQGDYASRKKAEACQYIEGLEKFSEVVYPGTIYTREDVDGAMKLFRAEGVDWVFALFLSWTEDFAWVRFLRDMSLVPIFFGCRTRDEISFADTSEETDFVEFLSAGGLVGALEASGSVKRFGRPMLVTSIGKFDELMNEARLFARAASVRSALRGSSFGLLASYNEVMWSTYVDPYNLFMKAGPELRFLSVSTLAGEIDSLDSAYVEKTRRALEEKYEILPDVDREKFNASVRASLALESIARKAGVSMVVLNDVDPVLLAEVGLRPGFLPCPGAGDVAVVPEGDIGGGLAVYILKQLAEKPVNFIEPFHIDAKRDCFAAGHAGPNDYTDPAGRVKIARDVRFAKTNYRHAGAPFAWYVIPPGRKTMLHVSECSGRFKMVCTLVDALPCEHFITSYSHGLFRPLSGTVQELFRNLLQTGVTQHYALAEGDYTRELSYLAQLLDFEFKIL